MQSLTFAGLSQATLHRQEQSWHPLAEWSPTDWACAMAGECGEACNLVKKLRRLQTAPEWNDPAEQDAALLRLRLGDELADLVIYADLLAQRLGIDLGQAVRGKFNDTSAKIGSTVRL